MRSGLLLLSVYPLSQGYLNALREKLAQDFEQLSLAELRRHGGIRLIAELRRIRPDALLLPIEDENSLALLPILQLLAGLTRAGTIKMVHPDLGMQQISRLSVAADVFRFGLASLGCLASAAFSWIELRRLLGKPRLSLHMPMNKDRVLYLKTNLWFGIKAGGSVGHIAGVVNALQKQGSPVTFASAEPPVMVDSAVEIRKIEPPKTFGLPYELNNYRFQQGFARTAKQILAQPGFSFIYQRLSAANYLGAVLSRMFRIPLVVEYNGSEVWIAKHWGRAMRFHALAVKAEEAMLHHAHLVVTISEVLRDELIAHGVEPNRIVCYPNCIDPAVFSPDRFSQGDRDALRVRYGIPTDATLVTFIGTFGQWHGAEVLAEAIAYLWTHERQWLENNKVHFLLVGDGLKMPQVRSLIDNADAQGCCTLAGLVPQDQAPLHLAAADLLVSPHVPNADGTRFFGSPTKLFEYMAMSKGIVASELEQIGEVLDPAVRLDSVSESTKECGDAVAVLVEPGDPDDLIRGIRLLVEDGQLRECLGKNARVKVLDQYTWQRHVGAIMQGLENVLTQTARL